MIVISCYFEYFYNALYNKCNGRDKWLCLPAIDGHPLTNPSDMVLGFTRDLHMCDHMCSFFFLNNTCNPHHKRPSWSTRHVNLLHLLTFGWFLSTFAVFDKGTLLKTESVSRWCVNYTNLDRFHGSSVVFFEWTNEEATCGHVPVTANYHCLFPDYAHLNKTVSDFLRAWLET